MTEKNYNNIVDETIDYLNGNHNFEGTSLNKQVKEVKNKSYFSNKIYFVLGLLIIINILIATILSFKKESLETTVIKARNELMQISDDNPLLMHSISQITEAKNKEPEALESELKNLNLVK